MTVYHLSLPNGRQVITEGQEYEAGAYVTVVFEDGTELSWDSSEWRGDPEHVMGAILIAMGAQPLDEVTEVD